MIKTPEKNSEFKLRDGDRIDLKKYFYDYFPVFVEFARKYVSDIMVCEDIVQNAFISFWESKNNFKNQYSVKGFFYTTIRNSCLDYLKHVKVEEKYKDNIKFLKVDTDTFLNEVIRTETYHKVYQEINKLPEMSKKVLLLALMEKSNQEIAASLNIAINTVKTHKARAYKFLRNALKVENG